MRHQGAARQAGPPPPDADADADADQDGDDGPAPVVVELAREEPGQDLAGAVAVLETGAFEHLVARRPMGLIEQWDDDPGGGCRARRRPRRGRDPSRRHRSEGTMNGQTTEGTNAR